MHLDVQDLRSFYYRTKLGRAAQKAIREQVTAFWPDVRNETVVGYGFAVPLLRPLRREARRTIALMPGAQGVMAWPPGEENISVLCEEAQLPLDTGFVDRLIVLHGLETSDNQAALLEECHRVLGPGGRALFIVPNRAGLWARNDRTPFGFGRPYSLTQLEGQLRSYDFAPQGHAAALYQPVSEKPFWLRSAGLLEGWGRSITGRFAGGVLIVEACKRNPPRPRGTGVRERAPLRALEGARRPVAGQARTHRPETVR